MITSVSHKGRVLQFERAAYAGLHTPAPREVAGHGRLAVTPIEPRTQVQQPCKHSPSTTAVHSPAALRLPSARAGGRAQLPGLSIQVFKASPTSICGLIVRATLRSVAQALLNATHLTCLILRFREAGVSP